MATIKEDVTLKYQTTTDADVEETQFSAGDDVELLQTWDNFYLIKDDEGHIFNIPKAQLDE